MQSAGSDHVNASLVGRHLVLLPSCHLGYCWQQLQWEQSQKWLLEQGSKGQLLLFLIWQTGQELVERQMPLLSERHHECEEWFMVNNNADNGKKILNTWPTLQAKGIITLRSICQRHNLFMPDVDLHVHARIAFPMPAFVSSLAALTIQGPVPCTCTGIHNYVITCMYMLLTQCRVCSLAHMML